MRAKEEVLMSSHSSRKRLDQKRNIIEALESDVLLWQIKNKVKAEIVKPQYVARQPRSPRLPFSTSRLSSHRVVGPLTHATTHTTPNVVVGMRQEISHALSRQ